MFTRLAPVLLLTALASCGAAKEDNQMNDSTTVAQFSITSEEIRDGQPMAAVHSCDGADTSPELSWTEPPPGTRSLALVVDDPDAPNGTFHHWAVFDMPPTRRSIASGEGNGPGDTNFVQALNDGGKSGYMGPCPPRGHGPHHYRFKLYALDVDSLELPPNPKIAQLEAEAQRHEVGLAKLTGTYERK